MAAKTGRKSHFSELNIILYMEVPNKNPIKHLILSLLESSQLFTFACLAYLFVSVTRRSQSSSENSWSKKITGSESTKSFIGPCLGPRNSGYSTLVASFICPQLISGTFLTLLCYSFAQLHDFEN